MCVWCNKVGLHIKPRQDRSCLITLWPSTNRCSLQVCWKAKKDPKTHTHADTMPPGREGPTRTHREPRPRTGSGQSLPGEHKSSPGSGRAWRRGPGPWARLGQRSSTAGPCCWWPLARSWAARSAGRGAGCGPLLESPAPSPHLAQAREASWSQEPPSHLGLCSTPKGAGTSPSTPWSHNILPCKEGHRTDGFPEGPPGWGHLRSTPNGGAWWGAPGGTQGSLLGAAPESRTSGLQSGDQPWLPCFSP